MSGIQWFLKQMQAHQERKARGEKMVERVCATCAAKFMFPLCRIVDGKSKGKFCSRVCSLKAGQSKETRAKRRASMLAYIARTGRKPVPPSAPLRPKLQD